MVGRVPGHRWTAAAIGPPERDTIGVKPVFRAITALALASASTAHSPATLTSTGPWWERVTVLVADNGEAQSCRYESSLQPSGSQDCTVDGAQAASAKGLGAKDQFTRITFERRFSLGAKPDMALQPGETLLGGRLMALAIDAKGAVKNCEVVATSGSVAPQYGCSDLESERFEASVGGAQASAAREGYMSIIVYGHSEHVV